MILYFSATGNCKYVAKKIAKATNDIAYSMEDLIKINKYDLKLRKGENFGVVTPTYNWQLPIIVTEYFSKLKIEFDHNYIFYIATYGTTAGQTATAMNDLLNKKIQAFYDIKMPDTWTVTYNLSNKEKINKILVNSDKEIEETIKLIKEKKLGNYMSFQTPKCLLNLTKKLYEQTRKTKHLSVSDKCIGCGLCATNCPYGAIEIQNNKPVWIKEKCVMCLRCLHNCPMYAIRCGKNTDKHGQYTHPTYKD